MPYQATVVNVMIAAPSDVQKEREIIGEILEEWNQTDAEHSRIVALPIGWQTHASPESGKRPQETINHQVLEKADILVAVFWTRLGTPTGEYDSGTVEEINKSIQDGRHVMPYFSDAAIQPSQVEQVQRDKLMAFREEMIKKALCGMYSNLDDFKAKFRRDIRNKLQDIKKSLPKPDAESALQSDPDWESALTAEAKELLVGAAKANEGSILRGSNMRGVYVQIGPKSFCETGNRRSEALWEAALEQLREHGLVGTENNKVFRVTDKGYQVDDALMGQK